MRKIFTLLAAMVCSFASFAQDIQLETKDGQVIENGSTVTIQGEMLDMMIYGQFESNLYVKNLTDKNQGVFAEIKVLLNKLVNQKQEIEMLPEIDYDGGVHKVFKVVDNKYVLKKTSNNSIEYEMLNNREIIENV